VIPIGCRKVCSKRFVFPLNPRNVDRLGDVGREQEIFVKNNGKVRLRWLLKFFLLKAFDFRLSPGRFRLKPIFLGRGKNDRAGRKARGRPQREVELKTAEARFTRFLFFVFSFFHFFYFLILGGGLGTGSFLFKSPPTPNR